MTIHVSRSQLERFVVGVLEDSEMVVCATHIADCGTCDKSFLDELRRRTGFGTFRFSLEFEFCFRDDHLEFDDLVGIADETVDSEVKEIFDTHMRTCEWCCEDLSSFLAFRKMEN